MIRMKVKMKINENKIFNQIFIMQSYITKYKIFVL